MQSSLQVITPAQSLSLVSLYEAKLALNLQASTDPVLDEQIEMMIEWASAEIAAMCNRTFARETVIETFSQTGNDSGHIYLSRWPVTNVSLITEDDVDLVVDDDYSVDSITGRIQRVDSAWFSPLSIAYTGGYDLPNDSPKALRHAALLLTRESYYAMSRGDASIKMVKHKESTVSYFDPSAQQKAASGGGGSGGSAAMRAVGDLLKHFTRFYV